MGSGRCGGGAFGCSCGSAPMGRLRCCAPRQRRERMGGERCSRGGVVGLVRRGGVAGLVAAAPD
eukprot:7829376-Lingulodinium_polyedra.AAC.1